MIRPHFALTLLLAFLPAAACSQLTGENSPTKSMAAGAIDVDALLGTVTDADSAAAAKGPLEAVLAQLKGLLPTGGAAATEATGGATSLPHDILAKFGISAGTVDTITSLLGNEAIAGVIGPVLNELKALIPIG